MIPPGIDEKVTDTLNIWNHKPVIQPGADFTDQTLARIGSYRWQVRRNNYMAVAAALVLLVLNTAIISSTLSASKNNLAQTAEVDMVEALRTDYFGFDNYNSY